MSTLTVLYTFAVAAIGIRLGHLAAERGDTLWSVLGQFAIGYLGMFVVSVAIEHVAGPAARVFLAWWRR